MLQIGFICPTYKALELDAYTRVALCSFFELTPHGYAIVVDDNSPSWNQQYTESLRTISPRMDFVHFETSGGLTRSWNAGLARAFELNLDYVIAGNNDIVFTRRWYEGLLHALEHGFAMAGPLSNAPGTTAGGKQAIERYTTKFCLTDDKAVLNNIADDIYLNHLGKVIASPVNGFFQIAKLSSWVQGKYDKDHYYCPRNPFTSKGVVNPTPEMTLNEDELQARWRVLGMESAIALSTYIFHYRAISRGDKYKKGQWYRKK